MGIHTATATAARDAAFAAMRGGFRLLDLTEVLGPESVMWPGAPAWSVEDVVTFEGGGYHARMVHTFEHAGTHLDAPGHLVPGAGDVASLPIEDLVVPVVVIDISEKAATEPNSVITAADVEAFEDVHGRIAAGSAVLMNSGWGRRNHDALLYSGTSGTTDLRFPGFGLDGAALLVERGSSGSGWTPWGSTRETSRPSRCIARSPTQQGCGTWRTSSTWSCSLRQGLFSRSGCPASMAAPVSPAGSSPSCPRPEGQASPVP